MSFVAVKKVRKNAILPTYGSADAAGADHDVLIGLLERLAEKEA